MGVKARIGETLRPLFDESHHEYEVRPPSGLAEPPLGTPGGKSVFEVVADTERTTAAILNNQEGSGQEATPRYSPRHLDS